MVTPDVKEPNQPLVERSSLKKQPSGIIPDTMKAMVLERAGTPLVLKDVPVPIPGEHEVLIKINACGICRTDLHIIDGKLSNSKLPLVPGQEIIGTVVKTGGNVSLVKVGKHVGVPWLGYTCGKCLYCQRRMENLCEKARFTGYTYDGGYAEYVVADERYCFPMPAQYANPSGAPLLGAGFTGYRAYTRIGEHVKNLGIYGFGAAAHIVTQLAVSQGKNVYAFTKRDDKEAQTLAYKFGATWAGASTESPPEKMDAAIIFASAGSLVPKALEDSSKAAMIVWAGIHFTEIPSFNFELLRGERVIRSVENLTRTDGKKFLALASKMMLRTDTTLYPLARANEALSDLRSGKIHGAAVLVMEDALIGS